jgi:hypothetical protein
MAFADLEIALQPSRDDDFFVDMRLVTNDSLADRRLDREPPASFRYNEPALRAVDGNTDRYGRQLAAQLFADVAVKTFYDDARKTARDLAVPLRVRLWIARSAARLQAERWELLYDPIEASPIAVRQDVVFSRYLTSSDRRPIRPYDRSRRLRALVAIADGTDLEAYQPNERSLGRLNLEAERARVASALAAMDVDVLAAPLRCTLDALAVMLRQGYDVLYLVCHGAIVKGQPVLYLERADGTADGVAADELVTRVRELQTQPRIIVLASCQSAGAGAGGTLANGSPLARLGPRLAEVGVPAVIAMQGDVTVTTAGTFVDTFFTQLRQEGAVDLACAAARAQVRERNDAWMPVLFSRLRTGRVWYEPGAAPAPAGFARWDALLNNIEEGSCTPILGGGLLEPLIGGADEIARSWAEAYACPMGSSARNELATVAQFLSVNFDRQFPRTLLKRHICRETVRRWQAPAGVGDPDTQLLAAAAQQRARGQGDANFVDAHDLLAALPFRVYVTTNPDALLADALTRRGRAPQVLHFTSERAPARPLEADPNDDARPPEAKPIVYHLFGRFNPPRSLVLSEDDHFEFLVSMRAGGDRARPLPDLVKTALADSGLLFLGFRLDDWSFRVLLQCITGIEGGARRNDYTNVAVQIDPEGDRIDEPELARRYVAAYLGDRPNTKIEIYWGTAASFLRELRRRWLERHPGSLP